MRVAQKDTAVSQKDLRQANLPVTSAQALSGNVSVDSAGVIEAHILADRALEKPAKDIATAIAGTTPDAVVEVDLREPFQSQDRLGAGCGVESEKDKQRQMPSGLRFLAMPHGFFGYAAMLPAARQAVWQVCEFLRGVLSQ